MMASDHPIRLPNLVQDYGSMDKLIWMNETESTTYVMIDRASCILAWVLLFAAGTSRQQVVLSHHSRFKRKIRQDLVPLIEFYERNRYFLDPLHDGAAGQLNIAS